MSDPETSSGLSAPEEARLRRLLADARHTAPMPDDVVGRLDDVLARLAVEEPVAPRTVEPERPDPVVASLDAQRRRTLRRRVAGGLLAAAALVVGGVAVPQLLSGTMSGSADTMTGDNAGPEADEGADAPQAAATDDPRAVATFPALEDLPTADVQDPSALDAYLSEESLARIEAEAGSASPFRLACRDVAWGAGRKLPIVFGTGSEREPGVAVVRGTTSEGRTAVDLFVCGRPDPVGSVEVPTR